jgi:Caspase domain.
MVGESGAATLGGKLNKRKFRWIVTIFLKFITPVRGGCWGYSPLPGTSNSSCLHCGILNRPTFPKFKNLLLWLLLLQWFLLLLWLLSDYYSLPVFSAESSIGHTIQVSTSMKLLFLNVRIYQLWIWSGLQWHIICTRFHQSLHGSSPVEMWMYRLDHPPVFVHVMHIMHIIHNNIRVTNKFFSWSMNCVCPSALFCCLSVCSCPYYFFTSLLVYQLVNGWFYFHNLFYTTWPSFHFSGAAHFHISCGSPTEDCHTILTFFFLNCSVFFPGFYSWRNTTNGSWFVQALCCELQDKGTSVDILTLLTFVIQRVALNFESNTPDNQRMHQQKQIPCVTTMLTRLLHFTSK